MWPLDYFEKLTKSISELQPNFADDVDRANAIKQVLEDNLTELDGFKDIEQLFTGRLLSPKGSILAVTLVYNYSSPHGKQLDQLEKILRKGCKEMEDLDVGIWRVGGCEAPQRKVSTVFYYIGPAPVGLGLGPITPKKIAPL